MDTVNTLQGILPWLGGQALEKASALMLLSIRVGVFLAMSPVFHAVPMPPTVRMLFGLGLAVALGAGLGASAAPVPEGGALFRCAIAEAVLGATMAMGVMLAFSAFSVAGQLLDVQIGFGIAQVFDPASQRQVSILTSVFQYAGVLVFFLLDGHHALLKGLAYSVQLFPVGAAAPFAGGAADVVIRQAGASFALGFALAAPVVFCVLLTEFALGVVARNLPQVNMFALGIPIKIVVGLLALSVWMSGMGMVMGRVYASVTQSWALMFSSMAAPEAASGAGR